MTNWIVFGLFRSWPGNEETWCELESYESFTKALDNAKNTNKHGIIVRGYHEYRIVKRTYTDKIVLKHKSKVVRQMFDHTVDNIKEELKK